MSDWTLDPAKYEGIPDEPLLADLRSGCCAIYPASREDDDDGNVTFEEVTK